MAKKWGFEKVLFAALICLISGIGIRSSGISVLLFIGTAIIGVGIAIGNTLLPGLLKRDFPNQITSLTSVYAITMGVASAIGSAIVIPLEKTFNWNISLLAFILLPVLSALAWLPQLKTDPHLLSTAMYKPVHPIWTSRLAWVVCAFFGSVSLTYYTITTWLPSIVVSQGYTPTEAGNLHGLMQLATGLSGIAILAVIKKLKDQRLLSVSMATLTAISLWGLTSCPSLTTLWVLCFGFGTGGAFILGLAFLGLRTSSPHQSASLSGMAQSCGYLMAATGPIFAGAIHDYTHSWHTLIDMLIIICVLMGLLGLVAGRNVQIKP